MPCLIVDNDQHQDKEEKGFGKRREGKKRYDQDKNDFAIEKNKRPY